MTSVIKAPWKFTKIVVVSLEKVILKNSKLNYL